MKLRYHPGLSTWPLTWLVMSGAHEKKAPGESAVFTNIRLSSIDPITTCYLTVEFENEEYLGTLLCKGHELCDVVYQMLQQNIGQSLGEIGDLDLSDVI